jgi:hypothetical protein
MLGRVVDHGSDSPIESPWSPPPYVELVECNCRGKVLLSLGSPFSNVPYMDTMIIITMIARCSCTNHSIL